MAGAAEPAEHEAALALVEKPKQAECLLSLGAGNAAGLTGKGAVRGSVVDIHGRWTPVTRAAFIGPVVTWTPMKGWLVAAGVLGGVAFLLHVGNPTGARAKPRGSVSNLNCRLENGVQTCDFGIERGFGLPPVLLGRFPLDSSPKNVMVDGVPRVIVASGSGFILQ